MDELIAKMYRDRLYVDTFPRLGGRHAMYFAKGDPAPGAGGDPAPAGDPAPDPDPADDPKPDDDPQKKALVDESRKYRQRAQTAEKELRALKENALSAEDRKMFADLKAAHQTAKEDKAKKAGDFDELLAQKQKAFDELQAKSNVETELFKHAFEGVAVTGPLQAALAARKVTDVGSASYLLQGRYEHRAIATLEDGEATVRVVDREGEPVTDADCEPGQTISVQTMVDGFLATPAGQAFLPPSGDSGSGARQGNDPKTYDLTDPQQASDFIVKHGPTKYMQQHAAQKKRDATRANNTT